LQLDLPPFQVTERTSEGVAPITRHVIDCKEENS